MENMKEITHSDIEAIIRRDEKSGQMDENRKIIMSNNYSKEELLAKNTPSESKLLANKADMPQSKATTMMKRIQKQRYADLSVQDLGVLNRLIKDYECSVDLYSIAFAGEDHPIFNRLIELANKYPNRRFIANAIRDKIDEKKEEIQMSIDTQKGNLALIQECEVIQNDYPYQWEEKIIEDLGERALNLFKGATAEKVQKNIDKLENNKKEVDKWKRLASKIKEKNTKSNVELKNNLYYEILDELERVYELSQNVGHVVDYKAEIDTGGFSKNDIYSSLARELERQVGLCEDADTHNLYYSNNEGRLVPYQLNRQFLKYINENTTFYKYDKNGNRQFKKGDIISAKALFNEVPDYCNKVQYRNQSLIGFNNCFYNIDTNTTVALNPKIPVMPLRNCKTELYLDEEIEDNPMKEIFQKCFTEEDRKTLLAYIGCCLYDHGYTQRQESLFIMGKGGTGKGLSIEEYLPTPTGWVQMKDLKVGDKLFDEKGNICSVTYKSPVHNIDCYKITFENGYEMIVDKEHRWFTKTENAKKMTVQNTEDMYNRMSKSHRKRDSFYFAINTAEPLQLDEKDFIIPPYTLGAWLGDGTQAEGIITNQINDNQIIKEIEKDGFITNRTGVDNNLRVYIHKLKDKLGYINVLNNKHIPQEYLRGNYQQRLSLLQGIMDTDGSIDKNGSCKITWASKQMIKELRELLFSLGIKSNINEKQVQLEGWDKPRIYYRLHFKTRLPVFRLKRKKDRIPDYPLRKTQYTRYIKKIEPVESVPTQCIQVDSPNHLFLAGKEFIPTHNTTLTKAICSIFYDVGNQLVSKLKSSNEFGLSVFADNDIIIIDEIQSAHADFCNYLKNISGGGNLPVEKKHHDTIVIPATNVPRMILIGNNFSKPLYKESGNAGINRRILIVIPTQPIQDLGFKWDELVQDSCKQWLAQEATKEYIAQGLHESSKPIGTDKDGASYISEVQKEERLKMCVYPERFFLERHFEYLQDENGNPIMSETISYDDLFDFVANEIDSHMVESTCKKDASNMFIGEVREALKIPEGHYTKNYNGVLTFTSVRPKTDEAIDFIAKRNGDDLNE